MTVDRQLLKKYKKMHKNHKKSNKKQKSKNRRMDQHHGLKSWTEN